MSQMNPKEYDHNTASTSTLHSWSIPLKFILIKLAAVVSFA